MKLQHADDQPVENITKTLRSLVPENSSHQIDIIQIDGTEQFDTEAYYYIIDGDGQIDTGNQIKMVEEGTIAHIDRTHTIEGELTLARFSAQRDT